MEKKTLIAILIIIILLISTIIFWARSTTNASKLERASDMSKSVISLIVRNGYIKIDRTTCGGLQEGDYSRINRCLVAVEKNNDMSKLFKEDDFKNSNPSKNMSGYIVIKNNNGDKTFQSENFTLFINNEKIKSGCTTPGDIKPGYTCRMEFTKVCKSGDNIEIRYNDKRAYLTTY